MSTPPTVNNTTVPAPFADVIEAARAAVKIEDRIVDFPVTDHIGVEHQIPVRLVAGGGQSRIEVAADIISEAERRAEGPRRRAGTVELGGVIDFIDYVNVYKTPDVVVFSPINQPSLTAIFDYHPATQTPREGEEIDRLPPASWCQDRATYKCPLSRQWKLWVEHEGRPFSQVAFGDFIEANELDLTSKETGTTDGRTVKEFAPAARMLDVARNLVVNTGAKYQRTINPTTGEGTLLVKDEHDKETSTRIPKAFALAIPVFEGDEIHYLVEALVRFSMTEGRPTFSYILQNKEKVLEDALAHLRGRVTSGTGVKVFVGTPPAAAR